MNVVNLIGRLVRDVECKQTTGGKLVARGSIAVDRGGDAVDFIPFIAWEKTAELIRDYTGKGTRVGLSGRLQSGSYEKDGVKHYTLDMVVSRVDFCDSKRDSAPKEDSDGFIPASGKLPFEE